MKFFGLIALVIGDDVPADKLFTSNAQCAKGTAWSMETAQGIVEISAVAGELSTICQADFSGVLSPAAAYFQAEDFSETATTALGQLDAVSADPNAPTGVKVSEVLSCDNMKCIMANLGSTYCQRETPDTGFNFFRGEDIEDGETGGVPFTVLCNAMYPTQKNEDGDTVPATECAVECCYDVATENGLKLCDPPAAATNPTDSSAFAFTFPLTVLAPLI